MTGRVSSQNTEIEELKISLEKRRTEQNKLSSEKTELQKLSQTMEEYVIIFPCQFASVQCSQ